MPRSLLFASYVFVYSYKKSPGQGLSAFQIQGGSEGFRNLLSNIIGIGSMVCLISKPTCHAFH